MTLTIRSSGAAASSTLPVLDMVEALEGYARFDDTNLPPIIENLPPVFFGNTPEASRIFPTSAGAGPTIFWDNAIQRSVLRQACQVASVNARSGDNVQYAVRMPMFQKFAAVGAIPIPLLRPLRSYHLRAPLRLNTVGLAANFLGVWRNTGISTGILPRHMAYMWVSDPALNAGAWTPAYRQVDLGPIVTLPASSVIPNAVDWNLLGVRYTEGPDPKFEWMLNDVPFAEVHGDANMPTTAVGNRVGMYPGIGCGQAAVGTILESQAARFTVEEV